MVETSYSRKKSTKSMKIQSRKMKQKITRPRKMKQDGILTSRKMKSRPREKRECAQKCEHRDKKKNYNTKKVEKRKCDRRIKKENERGRGGERGKKRKKT